MEESREEFFNNREKKYNGKIIYKTYAKLKGFTGINRITQSVGLLYIINDKIYYEDFEPPVPFLTTYAGRPKYTKIEFNIDINNVNNICIISDKFTKAVLEKPDKLDGLENIKKGLKSIFTKTDVFIKTKDGNLYIFNFLDNFKEVKNIKQLIKR